MPVGAPAPGVGPIDVSQLIGRPENIVEPRAVAALSQGFRDGFITADDVISRIGELGKTKQKAELQLAQEATSPEAQALRAQQTAAGTAVGAAQQAEALKAKVYNEFPAVKYFDALAPAAGIQQPTLPDGTPDYKKMEEIGAKLAVFESRRKEARTERDNIVTQESADGSILFARTKQGEPVDPKQVQRLNAEIARPFMSAQPAGTVESRPGADWHAQAVNAVNPPVVEPRGIPSATPSVAPSAAPIAPEGGIPPVGQPFGGGFSLGPPKAMATKAPTEAQQRAQLALSRFATSGDIQTSLKQSGYDPTSIGSWMNSLLPQIVKSGDRKQYEAATDLWSQGLLRLESGAAISRQEKSWYEKAFFPQVGDPENVVNAKEAARHDVERMVAEIAQQGGVVSPESKDQAQRVYERVNQFAAGQGASGAGGNASPAGIPTVSPEEARKLPPGTQFKGLDGQVRVRQ